MKAAAPEGTAREYFVTSYDFVTGVSNITNSIYMRSQKVEVIYGADNKVYIPNFLGGVYVTEPTWIEGTLSANGRAITVEGGQSFGTYGGLDVKLLILNGTTGQEVSSTTFSVDPDFGVLECNDYLLMEAYQGSIDAGFLTQIAMPSLYPTDNSILFDAPATRTLTATSAVSGEVSATVEDYYAPGLGAHFIKGLFQNYPDSWVCVLYTDDSMTEIVYSGQVIDADVVGFADDGSFMEATELSKQILDNAMSTECIFTNGGDGSYTQSNGSFLMDLYYTSQGFTPSDLYAGIKLSAPTPSGISSVTTDKGLWQRSTTTCRAAALTQPLRALPSA